MPLATQTLENIQAARTSHYQPPTQYAIPFRNIRDVLALHAKTSPGKEYLIAYDGEGTRTDLFYVEFVARVQQVANFLWEDAGIRRGDRIATLGYNLPDLVLIYFACWVIG